MSEYKFKLYSYWRSSCSWRVRLVLALKGIDYEYIPVSLLDRKQKSDEYKKVNPMQEVPTLVVTTPEGEEYTINQSLAIAEYLDTIIPNPPIFPKGPIQKAKCLALSLDVISGIQPLQNFTVGKYVNEIMKDDTQMGKWGNHFITVGLEKIEAKIDEQGSFACGDEFTFADMCILPQLYNARRFNVDLDRFPKLLRVEKECQSIKATEQAHPDQQPDAVKN